MPNKRDNEGFLKRAKDTYDSTAERFVDARDKAKESIQDNPFTSVIVAAAIGAVMGVATAEVIRAIRRSKRK